MADPMQREKKSKGVGGCPRAGVAVGSPLSQNAVRD